jgi:glycosyltransferase involved in cell wall biosynthesis
MSPRPFLVHDIHLKPEDRIDAEAMREKARRVRSGEPLRLVYAGRAVAIKGPFEWLRAMADLKGRGVRFHARWLGDGPLLEEMKRELDRLGLGGHVELLGFVADREAVSQALRDADLFVFCHKTLESPRCLIEAMIAACPIVGYDSAYPRDLLAGAGDELLTPLGDPAALTRRIAELDENREALGSLIERVYDLGGSYSDVAVFRHRSDLIKEHLGPVGTAADA